MAFTVKSEYERLIKIKDERERKSEDKHLAFECGCACGYVTRIEYQPQNYALGNEEAILVYAIAGFDNYERLALYITEKDVSKRYQDRKYKYWKQYGILESYVR